MNYIKEFKLCKKVVKEVGNFLLEQDSILIDSSEGKDIKLELDRKCEEILFKKIVKKFSYAVLSEELGLQGTIKKNNPYWIIDPIDGSLNFSKKAPFSCISVALWKDKKPIFGIIYDFNRDELFSAYVGYKAFLNDIEIKNVHNFEKSKSVLATGFPTYMSHDSDTLKNFIDQVQTFKKIRMIGSAALSLAYVSCGRFDAYFEENIKIWDVAAGIAINTVVNNKIELIYLDNNMLNVKVGEFEK